MMEERCVYLFMDMATGGTKFGTSSYPLSRLSQLRCRHYLYSRLVYFCDVAIVGLGAEAVARFIESGIRESHSDPAGEFCGKLDFTPDAPRAVINSLLSLVAISCAAYGVTARINGGRALG